MRRVGQQEFVFRSRGGKRKGAGRPPRGPRSSERHQKRPKHDLRNPAHITLRVRPLVGRLRKRHIYAAVQWAMAITLARSDFRICHISIQSTHIHLIVEADHQRALARGMQGFQISCAKRINAAISHRTGERRTGQVFADRYHCRPLTSPRQVHHALGYVLSNWRHHDEHRSLPSMRCDPFSNGAYAGVWRDGPDVFYLRPEMQLLPVSFPKTWMLATGWRARHGPLSPHARPGAD